MAEEKNQHQSVSSDDIHVLRELLHTIRGLSAVSTPGLLPEPIEAEN